MSQHFHLNRFAVACAAAAVLGAGPAWAGFVGSDNFDDNSVDATKWGADSLFNNGVLSEANGRLEFTASEPSVFNFSSRPWVGNTGSYMQSWAVQMDVHLELGSIGIFLNKSGALQTQALLSLVNNPANPGPLFNGQVIQDVTKQDGRAIGVRGTSSLDAALRIAFDAASKELYLQVDDDGAAGGYSWSTLTSADIDDAVHDWGMNDSSSFSLAVTGSSFAAVLSGQAYADNFVASVPEPGTLGLTGLLLATLAMSRRSMG